MLSLVYVCVRAAAVGGEDACACCSPDGERRRRRENDFPTQLTINSRETIIRKRIQLFTVFTQTWHESFTRVSFVYFFFFGLIVELAVRIDQFVLCV